MRSRQIIIKSASDQLRKVEADQMLLTCFATLLIEFGGYMVGFLPLLGASLI